ncbi:MAG: extracellular solute-binding protein [Betaproteobacteria bacterium]|nr:MAG: extracellular solute-binding protein [Betaproteobacteria bacterium]
MSSFFLSVVRNGALCVLAAAALTSTVASAAPAEVRWAQWKTTEVGEKMMTDLKAAFEKENPDVTLTLVDSPFTGFHDKAVVLFQAKKLPDVLLVQVDWVAEFADLGMLEPLDDWIAKEPKSFMDNIPVTFHQKWRGTRAARSRCSTTPRSSRMPGSPGRRRPGTSTWQSPGR